MTKMLSRRAFLQGSALAGAAISADLSFAPAIAQTGAIRIGLLTIKSGPLAQAGLQVDQGLTAFLKEKASTISGRKVDIIVADTGGTPAGARSKAQ